MDWIQLPPPYKKEKTFIPCASPDKIFNNIEHYNTKGLYVKLVYVLLHITIKFFTLTVFLAVYIPYMISHTPTE